MLSYLIRLCFYRLIFPSPLTMDVIYLLLAYLEVLCCILGIVNFTFLGAGCIVYLKILLGPL